MPSSQTLQEVLVRTLEILHGVEVFPFFGTLLGLVRTGAPIDKDDDVDLYADVRDYREVLNVLSASNEVIIYRTGRRATYVQFSLDEFPDVPIDIYFFRRRAKHIVDKWNFAGLPGLPLSWLIVPAGMVFPLKKVFFPLMGINVMLPSRSDAVCAYLYGSGWTAPKLKGVDYKTLVVLGAPVNLQGLMARAMGKLSEKIRRNQKRPPSH